MSSNNNVFKRDRQNCDRVMTVSRQGKDREIKTDIQTVSRLSQKRIQTELKESLGSVLTNSQVQIESRQSRQIPEREQSQDRVQKTYSQDPDT